jgi:hypothetical protein
MVVVEIQNVIDALILMGAVAAQVPCVLAFNVCGILGRVILEGDDAGRRDGAASFVYLSKILKNSVP